MRTATRNANYPVNKASVACRTNLVLRNQISIFFFRFFAWEACGNQCKHAPSAVTVSRRFADKGRCSTVAISTWFTWLFSWPATSCKSSGVKETDGGRTEARCNQPENAFRVLLCIWSLFQVEFIVILIILIAFYIFVGVWCDTASRRIHYRADLTRRPRDCRMRPATGSEQRRDIDAWKNKICISRDIVNCFLL
jgi:hypothetical protein